MRKPKHFIWHIVAHIRFFLRKSKKNNIPALSGRSAFFLILSIIPFLMFLHTLTVLLGYDPSYTLMTNMLQGNLEPLVYDLVSYIYDAAKSATSGFVIVTAVVALWSAGNGVYTITEGVTRVYHLRDRRLWLVKRIFSMGYTLVVLLLLAMGFSVMFLNLYLVGLVRQVFDNVFVTIFVNILQYFFFKLLEIMFLTITLKLFLLRRVKEKRFRSFRAILPGMILTTIAWDFLNWGVSIYLRYFSQSSIYGSLGTVVIVMMWIYFMIYIFLWGLQFNSLYRLRLQKIRVRPSHRKKRKQPGAEASPEVPETTE